MVEKSLQGIEAEEKPEKCPACGNDTFDREGDERFCKKCGFVLN